MNSVRWLLSSLLLLHVLALQFEKLVEEGVEFDGKTQVAVIESNDPGRKNIIKLINVKGGLSLNPATSRLGTKIENGTELYLSVDLLDYESLRKNEKIFSFTVVDTTVYNFLQVTVINLDDEKPVLVVPNCFMDEVINRACQFKVEDPDGMIETVQVYLEDDHFTVDLKNSSDFESEYYLLLRGDHVLDESYNLTIEAQDGAGSTSHEMLIEVRGKRLEWVQFPNTTSIPEEHVAEMVVQARDVDNKTVNYDVKHGKGCVHINGTTGEIKIDPIDRDHGITNITFEVVAYVNDPQSNISRAIALQIDDIDDNPPKIHKHDEENTLILSIFEAAVAEYINVFVRDIDEGDNSAYVVELSSGNADFVVPFKIMPRRGRGATIFRLAVDSGKFNYEESKWANATIELCVRGERNATLQDSLFISVDLFKN